MNKKYSINQKVNCNGVTKIVYASVVCAESEIDSILAMLEGQYTVMAELKKGGTDAVVSSYNQLPRVTFKAEGKKNMSGAIFASNGGLVIKNGLSVDEIAATVSTLHAFEDDISAKPEFNSIKPVITAGARA